MGSKLTPLAVTAIALLRERDMHPYEMYKLLLSRRQDAIVKIRPGSLYHTIDRLAEEGLVEPVATDRHGNRPERTIYRITEAGDSALRDSVAQHLREPVLDYTWFPVAVAEAHALTADDVLGLFDERLTGLRQQTTELIAQRDAMAARGVERRYGLTVTYLLAIRQAEIDWIESTTRDIRSGAIPWESKPPPMG